MKFTIALASATALGLAMGGAAWAGNQAYIDQEGAENSALIQQQGSGARAGQSNLRMQQDGDHNAIDILQRDADHVGSGAGGWASNNQGVNQTGDHNELLVDQRWGARLFEVQQDSTGATGPLNSTANSADVEQRGSNAKIMRIHQTYTGDGDADTPNLLTIRQLGGSGHYNGIGSTNNNNMDPAHNNRGVFQIGHGNDAHLTQTSANQHIRRVSQSGEDNTIEAKQGGGNGNFINTIEQDGNGNEVLLDISGAANGVDGLGQLSTGFAASVAGAYNRSVFQDGSDNVVGLAVTGNNNQFGFRQNGVNNSATNLMLIGNDNEIGVNQDGTDNLLDLGAIVGSSNDIGVSQTGGGNTATIDIVNSAGGDSDGNAVRVNQTSAALATNKNVAIIGIDGSNNLINALQDGDNSLNISLTGSFNNNTGSGFGGAAASVAGGLNPGDLFQTGSNDATLTVGNLGVSDSNLFAFEQNGIGNSITGTINGDGNEAVVAQIGNGNIADMSQVGNGNNLGISQ